jgi:hypothetical protein
LLLVTGGGENGNGSAAAAGQGMLGMLINLLVAEKSGFAPAESGAAHGGANGNGKLQEFADRMAADAMASVEDAMKATQAAKAALKS